MDKIVIVGASLAGTRAAQKLRSIGFSGEVLLVGEENESPYDRPPLSKQLLTGEWGRSDIELLTDDELARLRLSLRLGVRAEGLSVARREVVLSDGSTVAFDGLIVATGARARRLPGLPPSDRVHVIRQASDAARLAAAFRPGTRLGVLGGGFLGSEVASAAVRNGVEVTVVERDALPMSGALGDAVGAQLADIQRAHGVALRTGALVHGVDDDGLGVTVSIAGGAELSFDHVLVSIGAVPNVEWLDDPALERIDGLVVDERLFAADNVVAAGDVARMRRADGTLLRRVEHWTNAAAQGEVAATNLLLGRANATEFRAVPYVWSDQFGSRIEVLGSPAEGTRTEEIWSSADRRQLLYASYLDDDVHALVGVNAMRWIVGVRRVLQGATRLDQTAVADLMHAVRRAS